MHNPHGYGYPPAGYHQAYGPPHSLWGPGYYAQGFHAPVAPPPSTALPAATASSHLTNPRFLTGALFGALAAYVLTNETVQQNAIKAAVRTWSMVQGGVEEMKERFRDAEAELHAAQTLEEGI